MNLVTLINEQHVTLASATVVYSADETGALESAVASAAALATKYATASARIEAEVEGAGQRGYTAGYEAGLKQGSEQISAELLRLAELSQRHIQAQRDTTTQMAIEIVRRIAGSIAPSEVLAALAQVAAHELSANESVSLRVHPEQCDAVRKQLASLAQKQDAGRGIIQSVIADSALDKNACVLETQLGSVIADLDTQLQAIKRQFDTAVQQQDD